MGIGQDEIIPERNYTVQEGLINIVEADNGLSVNYNGIEKFVVFYLNGHELNSAEALRLAFEDDDVEGFHCSDNILMNATLTKLQQMPETASW